MRINRQVSEYGGEGSEKQDRLTSVRGRCGGRQIAQMGIQRPCQADGAPRTSAAGTEARRCNL